MEITLEEAFSGKLTIIKVQFLKNVDGSLYRSEKTLSVNLPSDLEDGMRIRLAGEGEHRLDGPPADLYIFISIPEHRLFKRDGADIHARVEIPVQQDLLRQAFEEPAPPESRGFFGRGRK